MKNIFIFLAVVFSSHAFAQEVYFQHGSYEEFILQREDVRFGSLNLDLHTAQQPYRNTDANLILKNAGRLTKPEQYDHKLLKNKSYGWNDEGMTISRKPVLKYFYQNPGNLLSKGDTSYQVRINPVLIFGYGSESDTSWKLFANTRGMLFDGEVGNKVGYHLYIGENQYRAPVYVLDKIHQHWAVPGEGYFKVFKESGVDFLDARGYISFHLMKQVGVQFGQDKNFIGDGYRSLFLSCNSNSYTFLKLTTRFWRFSYQNIFAGLTGDFKGNTGDFLRPRKYAAFHHLSFQATRNFNLGLFESVIFHHSNEGFAPEYLNPIIFYRFTEQYLGSPDNAFMGINWKWNLWRHISWYGQIMLDDLNIGEFKQFNGYWANKYGIQTGAKYFDAFGISHLDLQAEMNFVTPYTYTHSDSLGDYTNYNQEIAHPLGANFSEIILLANYKPTTKFYISGKIIQQKQGLDTMGSNWGSNVFRPGTEKTIQVVDSLPHIHGNEIGQGVSCTTLFAELRMSYEWRPGFFADASFGIRKRESAVATFNSDMNFWMVGIRINISNPSFDF